MLFKLSLQNIRKSVKDYAVYFFTLIVGVSVFYVFNAIESQSVMLQVSASTKEIIKLTTNMLSGVSVFVSFVLGFLIIFANSFLMKRRSQEFGLYLMLGMGKGKVSAILLMETVLVGLLSLGVGLLAGICLSQLMSIFVANMFEADMTRFAFSFSGSACIKTLAYFGIMYLFVMVFNTVNVGRCRLIDLLYSRKKTEQVRMKNPWVCMAVFLASSGCLGTAYYMVTAGVTRMDTADKIFIPILLGAFSTFFIFWSLSGLALKVFTSLKSLYFKGLNSFTLRQTASKINTTVLSMTVICLMLFVTICVLSSALTIKNSMTKNLEELAPADLELKKRMNLDDSWLEQGYSKEKIESSRYDIAEVLHEAGVELEPSLREYVDLSIFQDETVTFGVTLGSRLESIQGQFHFLGYDTIEDIVGISGYNRAAEFYGKETYGLEEGEYMIVADFDSMVQVRNEGLAAGEKITVFGRELSPKYRECKDGFLDMSSNHINAGILVVPDSVVEGHKAAFSYLIANYDGDTREEKRKIEEKLKPLEDASLNEAFLLPSVTTRISIAEASIGLGAMVTFIGLYLGIIFLISGAAILALKELSESADNTQRYAMLRKLGTDERMLNKALFLQIGIFFAFPLLLAVIHAVFGIRFCNTILEVLGNEQLLPSIVLTAVIITLIYGGYFLLTYLCSKNMIRE